MVVVTAISGFMWNAGRTVNSYFEYNTNVAVQILFNDTCTMPAVTICNQNNYR